MKVLKINKELTSRDGGKIEAGSIVAFQLIIPQLADEIHFDIFIYRNSDCFKNKKITPIYPQEIIKFGIVKKTKPNEIISFVYGDYIKILKSELELFPGIGKCIDEIEVEIIVEESEKIFPTKKAKKVKS